MSQELTPFNLVKQQVEVKDIALPQGEFSSKLYDKYVGISDECWNEIKHLHESIKDRDREITALKDQNEREKKEMHRGIDKHHPEVKAYKDEMPNVNMVTFHYPPDKEIHFHQDGEASVPSRVRRLRLQQQGQV